MVDPVTSNLAAQAYGAATRSGSQSDGETSAAVKADFGAVLQDVAQQVSQSGRTVEAAMGQAAHGEADLIDVVTAVAAAEANLETMIAVRDQFIKAYQEVMRMPI